MNLKPILIVNGILIALMLGLTVWVWQSIPDGTQLPVHWGLDGQADRYGSKAEALLVLPGMAVFLTAIFWFLPRLDPRRKNLEASRKLWSAAAISVTALLAYLHVFLVLNATGRAIDVADYMIPGISALLIVLGNYLPKTRSNWFAGVRTPWSMSSDYSWSKTHRLASRLFMGTGVLTIAAWLVLGAKVAVFVLIATLLATTLISVVASYVYWKNDPERVSGHVNGEA
jgi:uncharacterized membrane protein